MTEWLTSGQNPKIKELLRLRDRGPRDRSSQFIIEGYREILRAVESKWPIDALFVCEEFFLGVNEAVLIAQVANSGANVYHCSKQLFGKISYRDRPDGLIGLGRQRRKTLDQLKGTLSPKTAPLLVVAEAIEKPGNLGTILRSCDAAGADGLIVCDRCTDIFNPNVVRASVGTLFTVPTLEANGEETLHWLQENSIEIVAATPRASVDFTQADLRGPIAIAVGTEQLGLSKLWMDQATIQVRIPMHGIADSLNVAMATTLLLYEARRQRS